jgi:hypothetical protein
MYLRVIFGCLLALTLAGCGGNSNPLQRVAVSGNVSLDGQPLDDGTIQFAPTDPAGVSSGAVITNGTYSISAEQGLPPGTYIVRISAAEGGPVDVEPGGDATETFAKERIPAEYNTDSKHTVEVKAGAENTFDFGIESGAGT